MLSKIYDGFKSYSDALELINELSLRRYFLIPAAISILLAFGIFSFAFSVSDNLGSWIVSLGPFESWKGTGEVLVSWIVAILLVFVGFFLYKHIILILAAPFMSILSEKVERHIRGTAYQEEPFTIRRAFMDIVRGIRISLQTLLRELLVLWLLFLISFIPVVGLVSTIMIFLVQAYYAGFGNMDFILERHFNVSQSITFVRNHKGLAIANGTVFLFLLMTGIGFLFALPLATVAATVATVKYLEPKENEDAFV